MASSGLPKKVASEGGSSESGSSEGGADDKLSGYSSGYSVFEFSGWVYHLGVNSVGHEYCHLRYLCIRGKYVEMYKRDPQENPGIKPIRRGVIGHTTMVEELGRRKVNSGELYVLRFYNRFDETRKGEIACAKAGELKKWVEAFDHAKQQAEYELSRGGSARSKLNMGDEINLEGHRPRVRRYAYGLKKLIRIGQGPEVLLRKSSNLHGSDRSDVFFEADSGDAIEAHEWKCVRTINGVRIFEDVASYESGKDVLVKAVGVIDASADTVFEVVLSTNRHQRYEWDTLTCDMEFVDSLTGHCDVVYGIFDPRYLNWWQSKRDFVFSREWFRGQDGTYTILQLPAAHKKRPPKSGYRRTKINPSTWEIRNLNTSSSSKVSRCLVTQTLEIGTKGWFKWKKNFSPEFEKTIPFVLLSQVSGLKEYIGANPALTFESTTTVIHSKITDETASNGEFHDAEAPDEFYDAISADSSSEDDDSDNDTGDNEKKKIRLKNVSWAIASLALKRKSVLDANKELDSTVTAINLDACQLHGIMQQGKDENDTNCWTSPLSFRTTSISARFGGGDGGGGGPFRKRPPEEDPVLNISSISSDEVRLIDEQQNNVGIVKKNVALQMAEDAELDLVILAPDANPPVLRIMDYNKYRYEQQKRKKVQQKKAGRMDLKELKMGYNIDVHDYSVRLRAAQKFLKDGDKVKVIVNLKGREKEFRNNAIELIKRFQNDVGELASEEAKNFRDRNLFVVLIPNKAVLQKAKEEPKKKEEKSVATEISARV